NTIHSGYIIRNSYCCTKYNQWCHTALHSCSNTLCNSKGSSLLARCCNITCRLIIVRSIILSNYANKNTGDNAERGSKPWRSKSNSKANAGQILAFKQYICYKETEHNCETCRQPCGVVEFTVWIIGKLFEKQGGYSYNTCNKPACCENYREQN